MTYRTRVLTLILSLLLVTSGIGALLFNRQAQQEMLEQYHAKILSVAVTATDELDGDLVEQIREAKDQELPIYDSLVHQLRRIRDSNRREDIWVKYITTIYRDREDKEVIRFGLDAEESTENRSLPGDVYHRLNGSQMSLEVADVSDDPIVDQWGTWLTAYAPIKNKQGKVVAAIVIDIPYSRVAQHIGNLWHAGIAATLIALALGFLAALIMSRQVTNPLKQIAESCRVIGEGDFDVAVPIQSKDEFGQVARSLEAMAKGLKEREMIKGAFARYVSHDVLNTIISAGAVPEVHGERRRITVLFCDIRGFTTLSERLRPEEVVAFLNQYFERMVDTIFAHQGTLDKFIGDGMMVMFGAPAEDTYQEEHAVQTAVAMQKELRLLRESFKAKGLPEIQIGIGIHSGPAIVGNIGSSKRLEYTAVGDTVNVAARLESATKELNTEIVISESTVQALGGSFTFKKLGKIQVKGRGAEVETYTVG